MTKGPIHKSGIHIGSVRIRGRIWRDLINTNTPLHIDEMDVDADIGGDVVNKRTPPKQTTRRKRQRAPTKRPVRKAITHAIIGATSIASMVAASGIAAALGWA